MPRLRLDPFSPSGVSIDIPILPARAQSNGYVAKVQRLGELTDVDFTTAATNNQSLTYNSTTGKWFPQTITGGGGAGVTDGDKGDITVSGSGATWTVDTGLSADKLADGTTNKVFLATERTKLTGIATGATANSSDATLLARANHTGQQLASTISDFSTAADARISAAAGVSVASLTAGKIPSSQIPAIGLVSVQTAASQAAQLALTTQEGDVVVRTDTSVTYMRNAGVTGTMTDFTLLNTPTAPVTSVNSQTGVVVLAKTDIGLGNVDNTSDATKNSASVSLTNKNLTSGTNTFPTFNQNTTGTAASITGSITESQVTNLTTDLAAKQPLDSDLTTIASLTATTDSFLQSKASAWSARTPTQVTADLVPFVGDSGAGGSKGLVPAPASGDAAAAKYLKADGTWSTPAGGGGGGGSPGGSTTQVQFNDGGAFGGDAGMTYNKATDALTTAGLVNSYGFVGTNTAVTSGTGTLLNTGNTQIATTVPTGQQLSLINLDIRNNQTTTAASNFYGMLIRTEGDGVDTGAGISLENNGKADALYIGLKGKSGAVATNSPSGIGLDMNRGSSGENSSTFNGTGMHIWDFSTTNNGDNGPMFFKMSKEADVNNNHRMLYFRANQRQIEMYTPEGAGYDGTKSVLKLFNNSTTKFNLTAAGIIDTILTAALAGTALNARNTTDAAGVQVAIYEGDRATPAANDSAYNSFQLSNSTGTQKEAFRQTWRLASVTAGAESAQVFWGVMNAGTMSDKLILTAGVFAPVTNGGLTLGDSALYWSVIYGTRQTFNATAYMDGTTAGVIATTGDLQVATAGSNSASVVTVGGTQTLNNKTLTNPTIGAATATTINKVTITAPTVASTLQLDNGTLLRLTGGLLTLNAAGTTNMTFPSGTGTLVTTGSTATLTSKTIDAGTGTGNSIINVLPKNSRNNNGTVVTETASKIQSGWGAITTSTAATNYTATVTYPVAFTSAPIVMATYGGDQTTGTATLGGGGNIVKGPVTIKAYGENTTTFTVHIHSSDGTAWAVGNVLYYKWTAFGI